MIVEVLARLYQKQNVATWKVLLYSSFYFILVRLHDLLIKRLLRVELVGTEGKYERLYGETVLDLRVLKQRFWILVCLDLQVFKLGRLDRVKRNRLARIGLPLIGSAVLRVQENAILLRLPHVASAQGKRLYGVQRQHRSL